MNLHIKPKTSKVFIDHFRLRNVILICRINTEIYIYILILMNNDYHISNIFLQLHLLVEQCSSEFIDAWYHLYSFFQFLQMGMIKESIKQFPKITFFNASKNGNEYPIL